MNIVAVNTVLVLHLSQLGGLLAGRAVDRIYGGSETRKRLAVLVPKPTALSRMQGSTLAPTEGKLRPK